MSLSYSLQKAVNTPVNAISPASAHHLRDKLVKLSKLISGQPVELGRGHVVASAHPEGIAFCKNLLAKKFVVSIMVTLNTG
jgi:nucleoporin GLE1